MLRIDRLSRAIAVLLAVGVSAAPAQAQVVRTFTGDASGQMAVGNDRLYVADSGTNRVAIFTLDGTSAGSIPFNAATGIATDATGIYVVASTGYAVPGSDGRISKYSYGGVLLWTTPGPGLSGLGASSASSLSSDGSVVYLVLGDSAGIHRLDAATGSVLATWSSMTPAQVVPRPGGGVFQAIGAGLAFPYQYNSRLSAMDAIGADAGGAPGPRPDPD